MSKKNVIYLLSHMYDNVSGGAGTYAHYLFNAFKNNEDFDFVLVTHDTIDTSGIILKTRNLNNYYKNVKEYSKAVKNHSRKYSNVIVHANTATELYYFKETKFKLIANVNDYEVVDIYRLIPKFLFWYRLSAINKIMGKLKARYYEHKVLSRVDLVMANSYYTKDRIINGYGLREDKVTVIHKAVDICLFHFKEKKNYFKENNYRQKTILFVGTDWRKKGLKELLEAIALLKQEYYDLTLTIIGIKNESDKAQITKKIEKLHLDNINIHGLINRNKIVEFYENADLFVLPTKVEAFGVSYIEAMSVGLLTIGSNVGGVPEIIEHRVNGLLLCRLTKEEISVQIKTFLDQEVSCVDIIEHAKITASNFTTEVMLGKIIDNYRKLFGLPNTLQR